jgi:hypothetical protein
MLEPGLDRHEWESRMQALEEELRDEPAAGLPELADLVEQMLVESGYELDDPVARAGEEREVVAEYVAARETSDRVERDDPVDPGDIGAAIEGLRSIFHFLTAERTAP